MTFAIDGFAEIEILAQRDKSFAVPKQREPDLHTRSRIHPNSFRRSLVGRVSNEGSATLYAPLAKDTGLAERIGKQVCLVRKVFAIFPHNAVQVRRRHHEDRGRFSTQGARELLGPMCARVNAPLSEHPFRAIIDPLSRL